MTHSQHVPKRRPTMLRTVAGLTQRAWSVLAAAAIAWLLHVGLVPSPGSAAVADDAVQTLPAPVAVVQPAALAAKGTEFCVRCHRSEQTAWIDTSTTAVWRHDAHSRAHLALSSENLRTRGMETTLGITAARTAACVACHTHPANEPAIEEETAVVHAGISCETCHGAGSRYFEPHMEPRWRFLSSAEKESFGMHDLRNPVRKAENCLSCHLGDVASGKVITHAMYAAGHPPLPSFEMESFGKAMGPHWKRIWEKPPQIQRQALAAGYRTEAASESQRTLIGALVALRPSETMPLQATAAPGSESGRNLRCTTARPAITNCGFQAGGRRPATAALCRADPRSSAGPVVWRPWHLPRLARRRISTRSLSRSPPRSIGGRSVTLRACGRAAR